MTEQTQPAPQAAPQQPPQITPEQEVLLLRSRLEQVCGQRNESQDRLAILQSENAILRAQLQQMQQPPPGAPPAPDAPRRGRKRLGVQPKG